jgi:hypothetical protein
MSFSNSKAKRNYTVYTFEEGSLIPKKVSIKINEKRILNDINKKLITYFNLHNEVSVK